MTFLKLPLTYLVEASAIMYAHAHNHFLPLRSSLFVISSLDPVTRKRQYLSTWKLLLPEPTKACTTRKHVSLLCATKSNTRRVSHGRVSSHLSRITNAS